MWEKLTLWVSCKASPNFSAKRGQAWKDEFNPDGDKHKRISTSQATSQKTTIPSLSRGYQATMKDADKWRHTTLKATLGKPSYSCKETQWFIMKDAEKWSHTAFKATLGKPSYFCKQTRWFTQFCIDYRKVNMVTKANIIYPLLHIDDLLDQLEESQYFTTLELVSKFWQI